MTKNILTNLLYVIWKNEQHAQLLAWREDYFPNKQIEYHGLHGNFFICFKEVITLNFNILSFKIFQQDL